MLEFKMNNTLVGGDKEQYVNKTSTTDKMTGKIVMFGSGADTSLCGTSNTAQGVVAHANASATTTFTGPTIFLQPSTSSTTLTMLFKTYGLTTYSTTSQARYSVLAVRNSDNKVVRYGSNNSTTQYRLVTSTANNIGSRTHPMAAGYDYTGSISDITTFYNPLKSLTSSGSLYLHEIYIDDTTRPTHIRVNVLSRSSAACTSMETFRSMLQNSGHTTWDKGAPCIAGYSKAYNDNAGYSTIFWGGNTSYAFNLYGRSGEYNTTYDLSDSYILKDYVTTLV